MPKTVINEKKRNFIYKYELEILSVILVAIYLRAIINYDSISFTQFATGIFAWFILLHEWEETRYPGGFSDLCGDIYWIDMSKYDMGKCHLPVVVLILLFAIVPLFFDNCMPIVFIPVALMILEWVIHVVWIKLNHMENPYTPWMITWIIMCIYWIYVSYHLISLWEASCWDLLLWFIFFFAIFIISVLCTFKLMHIKPKTILENLKKKLKG